MTNDTTLYLVRMMDEEPSTSGGIKCHIPLELQNEIDELASKHSREAGIIN